MPLLTISPYARPGTVDHTQGEFSSVLRFIEDNWGLTQLTRRDEIANNLAYNFDFTQTPLERRSAAAAHGLHGADLHGSVEHLTGEAAPPARRSRVAA